MAVMTSTVVVAMMMMIHQRGRHDGHGLFPFPFPFRPAPETTWKPYVLRVRVCLIKEERVLIPLPIEIMRYGTVWQVLV